jgi:hypothetical protein
MTRHFERISRGMTMDAVEAILGPPEESYPTSFGAERMTTWTYHVEGQRFFVWFDENGEVKLKSGT